MAPSVEQRKACCRVYFVSVIICIDVNPWVRNVLSHLLMIDSLLCLCHIWASDNEKLLIDASYTRRRVVNIAIWSWSALSSLHYLLCLSWYLYKVLFGLGIYCVCCHLVDNIAQMQQTILKPLNTSI